MNRQTEIERSLIKRFRKDIWNRFIEAVQSYKLINEGDKIAVNGVASEALGAAAHGKKSAQFTINAALEHPLDIVYPAPAEGVVAATSGLYPVTFPATQNYTVGTFESGTAPMYGYAAAAAGYAFYLLRRRGGSYRRPGSGLPPGYAMG